jgi:hypothetical protein
MIKDACFACGVSLVPVFEDRMRRANDYPQYTGALVIDFRGGYGMYFDDGPDSNIARVVICDSCTSNLSEQNPWIRVAIEQYAGNVDG